MTWSYNDNLGTNQDMVRFLIGDTDTNRQLVSDEGIQTMLTMYEDVFEAGAALCDGLAVKFARIPTLNIDGLSVKGIDRAEQYRITAANLRKQSSQSAAGSLGVPSVSGVSLGDMDGVTDNPDRVPDKFQVGGMDFPGTVETANGPGEQGDWWPWP